MAFIQVYTTFMLYSLRQTILFFLRMTSSCLVALQQHLHFLFGVLAPTQTDRLATGLTQPDLGLTPGGRTRQQDRGQRSTGRGRESEMGDFFYPSSLLPSPLFPDWPAHADGGVTMSQSVRGEDGSGPAADFLPPRLAALCGFL